MKIKCSLKDLEKCFDFAIKYHLDSRKSNVNRTTGQYRGLGAIINDFLLGKLVEVAVAKAIGALNPKIKCGLDFSLWEGSTANFETPDIISVKENTKQRDPQLYIEIKNSSVKDRWIGITEEQYDTLRANDLINSDPSKIFMIYASLMNIGALDSDLLGIYLKRKISKHRLIQDSFAGINEIYVEIKFIITGSQLEKEGVKFKRGRFLFETELFKKTDLKKAQYYIERSKKVKPLKGNYLPLLMSNKGPLPDEFGKIKVNGEHELFVKENEKSNAYFIRTLNKNITVTNDVLGKFKLTRNSIYRIWLNTVGQDPILKRNNIWISNRKLLQIGGQSVKQRLSYIAKHI